ncbi:MAG: hypothetical protein ACP5HQ_07535 [Thermoprotei archaeon]
MRRVLAGKTKDGRHAIIEVYDSGYVIVKVEGRERPLKALEVKTRRVIDLEELILGVGLVLSAPLAYLVPVESGFLSRALDALISVAVVTGIALIVKVVRGLKYEVDVETEEGEVVGEWRP